MDHSRAATLDPLYAAPDAAPHVTEHAAAHAARLRARGGKLLLASVVGFGLSIVGMAVTSSAGIGSVLFLGSALLAFAGAGHCVAALAKLVEERFGEDR